MHRSCTGGKTEDFFAAAKLLHKAGGTVQVPTYLVPATQKVWADVYSVPVPGCDGKTAAEIFEAAGCVAPGAPSCAACLGGPKDTFARMNEPEIVVSTTNRCVACAVGVWWCTACSQELPGSHGQQGGADLLGVPLHGGGVCACGSRV